MTEVIDNPVTIIAEAGVNHNGSIEKALDLVELAAEAGADYVKFQGFNVGALVTTSALAAEYQKKNTRISNQSDLLSALSLSIDNIALLAEACRETGIKFLCTPFDISMTQDLISLGMDCIKIASGEVTNTQALERFAETRLPIIMSTGMCTMDEVGEALAYLQSSGSGPVTLLQCTSLYPAPAETLNLRAMVTMAEEFAVPVGFSDHSLDDHAAIAAVALGASVIEKHFTLDCTLPGPDHGTSLEPNALRRMIKRLRDIQSALGDGVKYPSQAELDTAKVVRRSWHSSRLIPVGSTISEDDVTLLRPLGGLAPKNSPIGKLALRTINSGEAITIEDVS